MSALRFVLLVAVLGCTPPERGLVAGQSAPSIVMQSFGEAWSTPSGPFRVQGAEVERTRVVARLESPDEKAWLTLGYAAPGDAAPDEPDAPPPGRLHFVKRDPARDLVVRGYCQPDCGPDAVRALEGLADRIVAHYPGGLFRLERGFVIGREHRVGWRVSAVGWIVLLVSGLGWAFRRWRQLERGDVAAAGLASLATLLAAVLLTDAGPANWYANLLPVEGTATHLIEKNGVAGFVAEAAVRAVFGWNERVLFAFHLVVGMMAAALAFAALRALEVPRPLALTALTFTAVLPAWARIVHSDAQHVLVAALYFAAVWGLAAGREGPVLARRLFGLAALMLLPLTRPEALVLAGLVPVLTLGAGSLRRWGVALVPVLAVLVASAMAVKALFIDRFRQPAPSLEELAEVLWSRLKALPWWGQLVDMPPFGPRWLPLVTVGLMVVGAVVMVRSRPRLLVVLAVVYVVPQLILDRLAFFEGMVGARYFLPIYVLLALVAAEGALLLAHGAARLPGLASRRRALAVVVVAVLVTSMVLSSRAAYAYRYAFQAEYSFLLEALERVPKPARVLSLAVRHDRRLRKDLDCCLDPSGSPLALAWPDVTFENIPLDLQQATLTARPDEHVFWFESALCSLAPTEMTEGRNPGIAADVAALCARLKATPGLVPIAQGEASPGATWPFFEDRMIPLRLYRVP